MAYIPPIPKDGEETIKWLQTYEPRNYELIAKYTQWATIFRSKGKPLSSNTAQKISDITSRYNTRQNTIRNSTVLKVTQSSNYWTDKLNKFFGISGIGAFPLVPVAIGLAVGTLGAWVVYQYFYKTASESRQDWEALVNIYPELKNIYDNLPTEQKENLKKVAEDLAQNEYNRGKSQTPLSFAKSGFYVLLGLYLLKQLKPQ